MKNIIKGIGIFVVGTALGVGGSYKYFEKKFGDIADAEIESIKMMARNKELKAAHRLSGADIDGDVKSIAEEFDGDTDYDKESNTVFVKSEEEKPSFTKEEIRQVRTSYNEISAAYKTKVANSMSREPVERVTHIDRAMEEPLDLSNQKPIVISDKEFVEECLDYDKVTLHYYSGDGVVLDENEDVFTDYEDEIGHDTLDQFGAFGVGENLLYVRNDKTEIDYEIIKFDEAYM